MNTQSRFRERHGCVYCDYSGVIYRVVTRRIELAQPNNNVHIKLEQYKTYPALTGELLHAFRDNFG